MSDPIQSIARHLGIQTFGDGLLAKIGQTIDLLQEAARNRADLAAECERLREETAVLLGDIAEIEVRRDAALAELAALKGGQVVVAMIRYARGVPGFENEMPHVVSCNDLPDGLYPVYLAPPAQASAWADGWRPAPLEPTPAMIDVAVSHALMVSLSSEYNWSAYMRDVWLRMLSAAPTPGASDGKGGDV